MKTKVILSSFFIFAICFSGCSSNKTNSSISSSSIHEHTFSNEWSYNETHHWHDSTCGHDVIDGKEEHIFSHWHYSNYEKYRSCEKCGYKESKSIDNDFYNNLFVFTLNEDGKSFSVKGANVDKMKNNEHISGDIAIPDYYNDLPVTIIEDNAFYSCTKITSLIVGKNVQTIGEFAFRLCREMTYVDLGESLKTIGNCAFDYCDIKELVLPETLESIEEYAFSLNVHLTDFVIPKNVKYIGPFAFYYCVALKGFKVDKENSYLSSKDGIIYSKDFKNLIAVPQCIESKFELPNGLKRIEEAAFNNNEVINELVCPESLLSIGDSAFYIARNMNSVTFNDNLMEIGSYAFCSCSHIKSLNIPSKIQRIEEATFNYLTDLQELTLPSSVIYLGHLSFANTINLQTITFTGTMKRWNDIEKDEDWCFQSTVNSVVCVDGTIDL